MATKRRVECDSAPSCAIPENQEANSEIQQLLARALANSQAEKEYKHYTAISYKKQARRYVIKVRTDQNREQYIHVRLRDGKRITAFGIEEGKTLEDSLKF